MIISQNLYGSAIQKLFNSLMVRIFDNVAFVAKQFCNSTICILSMYTTSTNPGKEAFIWIESIWKFPLQLFVKNKAW